MCELQIMKDENPVAPLCKDCTHCRGSECKKGPYRRNLTTGCVSHHQCDTMRQEWSPCGPDGNLFERKAPTGFERLIALFK